MKYIIVGGVAGGASFACRLRRLDESCQITIYEKTNFVSYANCGLPYYISSVIDDNNKLTLQTPQSLKARFDIDVFVHHEVIKIDRENRKVIVKDLSKNKEFSDSYDKLILSVGAEAIKLAPTSNKIYELKTVEDSLRIKEYISENDIKKAIVIGGGFIGLEIAENLKESGLEVTILEGQSHVLANFDNDMASFIHDEIRKNGVNLKLNTFVKSINEDEKEIVVETDKGTFKADILIQAVGVRPASKLAKDAGLELDIKNSIKTDESFKTSDPNIYAIGDVISLNSFIDNSRVNIPLAGLANKEGRELANILVLSKHNEIKPLGSSILKVFNLVAASTGFNETQLKNKNIPYNKIYLSPANHATYYPNSSLLTIKFMFNKETYDILGAEIVGENGVDKRIDVIATAMTLKAKAYELSKLELSYAPPFGSAKDPINMIGYMVENIKNGLVDQFFIEDIDNAIKDKTIELVDVRTPFEYQNGHIENSINIPVDEIRNNLDKLDKSKTIYLICQSALRSYIALRILSQLGYKCKHLAGGYRIFASIKEDQKAQNK